MKTRKVEFKDLKVGDKVLITGNETGSENKIGEIGVISEIDEKIKNFRVNVKGRKPFANWTIHIDVKLIIKE